MKKLGTNYKEIEERQAPLFFPAGPASFSQAARTHDPESSHIAVEEFTQSGARLTHCEKISEAMEDLAAMGYNAVTGGEIAQQTGLTVVQVLRRMNDLVNSGKVVKGAARTCKTDGKTKMLTWNLKG